MGDNFRKLASHQPIETRDGVLVLSVGGGNLEQNVSPNLVAALQYAKSVGSKIGGIVGRDGGYTAKFADACGRSNRQSSSCHAAFGSVSSRRVAPSCFASFVESCADALGICEPS